MKGFPDGCSLISLTSLSLMPPTKAEWSGGGEPTVRVLARHISSRLGHSPSRSVRSSYTYDALLSSPITHTVAAATTTHKAEVQEAHHHQKNSGGFGAVSRARQELQDKMALLEYNVPRRRERDTRQQALGGMAHSDEDHYSSQNDELWMRSVPPVATYIVGSSSRNASVTTASAEPSAEPRSELQRQPTKWTVASVDDEAGGANSAASLGTSSGLLLRVECDETTERLQLVEASLHEWCGLWQAFGTLMATRATDSSALSDALCGVLEDSVSIALLCMNAVPTPS